MIISQTPLRISFFGGGTDLKSFYSVTPGSVFSATIDKYVYVIIKERFDKLIYIGWSNMTEKVANIDEIKHDLVREALRITGIDYGVEITMLADIPSSGSGLGSSSSITVGLLNAMHNFQGNQVPPSQLAMEACQIEIDILKKPIGKQDQYAAAYGGINEIIFNSDESVIINKFGINNGSVKAFGSELLLYYTEITRSANSILTKQNQKTTVNFENMMKMRDQVPIGISFVKTGDYQSFGKLLDIGWKYKKSLVNNISNSSIDQIYAKGIKHGASGGKLSGAGGGGFILFHVPREKQNQVREGMSRYRELPFMLEPHGSKIIFNIQRGY